MEIISIWHEHKGKIILNKNYVIGGLLLDRAVGKYFWALCWCGERVLLSSQHLDPFLYTKCIPMSHHPMSHHPYQGGLGGSYFCPRNLRILCA